MLHGVIMAGGGGTRFWPRSRGARPKQFLELVGDRALLQQACDRLKPLVEAKNTWVITSRQHQDKVKELLPILQDDHIVGEPMGRDTAACIGLGAALVASEDPDAIMVVTPADHVIEPDEEFSAALRVAADQASEHTDALITFGIRPGYAATSYGYIHRGAELAVEEDISTFKVLGFREKPAQDLADEYFASGEYYWNSGIFVWKAKTILKALKDRQPQLAESIARIAASWNTSQRNRVFEEEYEQLTKISIDYAVMEHAENVLVIEAPFQWDDVGSWLALQRLHGQDEHSNTILAQHCGIRTNDCVIYGEPGTLITTIGVDNLLIVQDGNAILVADKRDEAAVKQLVELMAKKGFEEFL